MPSRTCSLYMSAFTRLTSSEGGKRGMELVLPGRAALCRLGGAGGGVSELTVQKEISDVLKRRLEAEGRSDFYGAARLPFSSGAHFWSCYVTWLVTHRTLAWNVQEQRGSE